MREACTEDIKFRVRMLFRQKRHLTGTDLTKKYLLLGYKFLDTFKLANQGDAHAQVLLQRYSSLIAVKRSKAQWMRLARTEFAWQTKLRNRPMLTGGFLRPTLFNKPLPRLKPQPLAITLMIAKRRSARERRMAKMDRLQEELNDLKVEGQFEDGLRNLVKGTHEIQTVYGGECLAEWKRPIRHAMQQIYQTFNRDAQRNAMSYSPEMLDAIKRARRDKIINKTRERERERRGEVLRSTIRRRNKGPPAHALARMTPEQRHMDKVVRSVSEVGYVGQVKRRLGFRLRDPEAWKVEIGKPEDKERLDAMMRMVERENELRRKQTEMEIDSVGATCPPTCPNP